MINSKEKLRRLGFDKFINVDINPVIRKCSSLFSNDETKDCSVIMISGVIRFYSTDGVIKIPSYRVLILVNESIYCYRKLHRKRVVDLSKFDEVIKFSSSSESIKYWNMYIKNDVIQYRYYE